MPVKFKIAGAVLAALIIQDRVRIRPLKTKFNKLAYGTACLYEENELLREKAKYLFHMLEENDVEPTDFDLIVLTHDIPQD
jgi:hypothetical protein